MSLKVEGKVQFPKFNFQPELEKIATKVIRPDIQKRMKDGINISGGSHKPNASSTILYKALRGLRTEVPLIASGQLLSSFRIAFRDKDSVVIYPAGLRRPYPKIKKEFRQKKTKKIKLSSNDLPTNNELADILQNQRKYEFFGISEEAEKKAIKFMETYIKKAIRDAK
jgi:hypothetical protein